MYEIFGTLISYVGNTHIYIYIYSHTFQTYLSYIAYIFLEDQNTFLYMF